MPLKPFSCLSFPSSWDYGDTLPLSSGKQSRIWRDGSALRVLAALLKDLSLVPSTNVRQYTNALK